MQSLRPLHRMGAAEVVSPAAATITSAFVVAGMLPLTWLGSTRALSPPRVALDSMSTELGAIRSEPISVKAGDGTQLMGRFLAGRTPRTVVLSHGYGGHQAELLPLALALYDKGFSVLTYDLRGCGLSGGTVTFGIREQDDLSAVVDYLSARDDVDPRRIGAFGFSMGGATTILAAARDRRIRAVAADSAWADVRHWLRPRWRDVALHPAAPFSPSALALVRYRAKVDWRRLRPSEHIHRIGPRPVLLVAGLADEVVPPGDAERNFAAAGEPKELWTFPDTGHGETFTRPSYCGRVAEFFDQALSDS